MFGQLDYTANMQPAVAGLLADIGNNDVVTGAAEERALDGHFMSLGTVLQGVKAPAAAADVTDLQKARGIVVRSLARPFILSEVGLLPGYPAKSAVSILRQGRIWVVVEDAVTIGTSRVYVRVGGTTGNKGAFSGAGGGDFAQLPDTVAKWVKGSTGAGLAQLEINL